MHSWNLGLNWASMGQLSHKLILTCFLSTMLRLTEATMQAMVFANMKTIIRCQRQTGIFNSLVKKGENIGLYFLLHINATQSMEWMNFLWWHNRLSWFSPRRRSQNLSHNHIWETDANHLYGRCQPHGCSQGRLRDHQWYRRPHAGLLQLKHKGGKREEKIL